jgi:hypothetical protein
MTGPNEFQPLMDAIFREKVLRARAEAPEDKFIGGIDLFEEAVERMRAGVHSQFPSMTEDEVETEVVRRINRVRQVQEHGFYTSTPPSQ